MQSDSLHSDKYPSGKGFVHTLTGLPRFCFSKATLILIILNITYCPSAKAEKQNQKLDLRIPSVRQNYIRQLAQKQLIQKSRVKRWARERKIPIRHDDGYHIFELMYIDENDQPVYNMTHNVNAAISVATDLVRNTTPYNLNGSGLTAGVWDAGSVLSTHQEFGSRVTLMDAVASDYHSTHVGGTIGAAGVASNAIGMAPSANIDSYDWNSDSYEMAERGATEAGEPGKIYVSNHSYGHASGWVHTNYSGSYGYHWYSTWSGTSSYEDNFGQYDSTARTYDQVAYGAPYYLIFKSAGNDRKDNPSSGSTVYYKTGITWHSIIYSTDTCPLGDGIVKNGYDTMVHYAIAKNIMSVGSVSDAVHNGTRSVPDASISSFSGWGPADDGRIKPDIVTNGESLYSTYNTSNSAYASISGTSMASPVACGSAILLVQYYNELFPPNAMLSSTLKALILHTADDRGNPGPDYSYGWGLMNTKAAADVIADQNNFPIEPIITESYLDSGNPTDSYQIYWDGNSPLKATLCWTDPPGSISYSHDDDTPKLVHDLDMRLIGPAGSPTYYPYILNPANPSETATTGNNYLDNVEQISLSPTQISGIYTFQISYKDSLAYGSQDYSLIITGQKYLHTPQPPVAEDVNISTLANTSVIIELLGYDDGLPDPPALDYIITTLPANGSLSDPNVTEITAVPYTLTDGQNKVIYSPDPNFSGMDSFLYKLNDGGIEPNGGDSNTATVTIDVNEPNIIEQYTLTVSSTTGGSVISPGQGQFLYDNGTVVDLNALPDTGYNFLNWAGDTSTITDVNAALTTITVDANYTITAQFELTTISPVITSTPPTAAAIYELYTYDVNATGIPEPTYTLTTAPNDMIIDSNTGLIQWTPQIPGDVNITVQAENIAGADTQNFIISVSGIAPIIISVPPITAVAGQNYIYDVNATGIPAPAYTLITAPNDMTIDPNTGLIQWTPGYFDINLQIPVTIEAMNLQSSHQQSFTIDVSLGDNFNDNTKNAIWRSFYDSYNLAKIIEDNNRLEISVSEPNNYTAAFYVNNNWTLARDQNFALQIDFHYDLNSPPKGWVGMSVENQQDYLAISAGSDGNESYYYFEAPMDGFTLVETETRDTNEGSLYMWYHADSNSMYLSTTGFKTEDAHVWNVLGDSVFTDWLSPVNVFIGTGSDGDPINGDIAWLDNFKMVRGTLNDWPPVTDLDINGFIDLDDIAVLVYYWLTDPNGLPDFDNDGTVNLTDLAELTNAY